MSGQGSHFPQGNEPAKTSALPASTIQARDTIGPEAGGSQHVGTLQRDDAAQRFREQNTVPSSGVVNDDTKNLSVSAPADASGVTSSAALAAATTAWSAHNASDNMPGSYPGSENPYKATHPLDPRVDGGKASDPPTTQPITTQTNTSTTPASSSLTTTTDPTERSTEYSQSADTRGLDAATSTSPTMASTTGEGQEHEDTLVNRVLGAVGLTGAVSAATAALGYGHTDTTAEEPHDSSAVATQPGQLSPETGPPKHYRRESIPTTAYPAGINSPRAVAPPVGGTQPSLPENETSGHLGRDAGIATGAGTGIAGGVAAADELGKSRDTPASTVGHSSGTGVAPTTGLGLGNQTSGVSDQHYTDSQALRQDVAAPSGRTVHDSVTSAGTADDERHTGRDVAAGGAAAAAVGAGAFAVHEHDKQEPVTSSTVGTTALPDRSADKSTYTIANNKDKSPVDAVAAAPGRYDDQAAHPTAAASTVVAGGVGAGIGSDAAHHKELEKEEKKHQKELEKEEKQHQKEIEKEEKQHQKEVEKEEKAQAKEMEKERKEHEKAIAAAGVGAGATGAGVAAHEHETATEQPEKKPNIFKRIGRKILRRKNKDTGEDEDYSTDEEEVTGRRSVEHSSSIPSHESKSKGRNVLGPSYEEASGGVSKPSYNPLKPAIAGADDGTSTGISAGHTGASTDPATFAKPVDPHTGLEYDPTVDPETAGRLGYTGTAPEKPLESYTGLAYDPAKDPEAARRLSEHPTGSQV